MIQLERVIDSIKSFVRRQNNISAKQRQDYLSLWPDYGIELNANFDLKTIFPKTAPLVLEIGFGDGQCLLNMAQAYPDLNFIGIEVYKKGIIQVLQNIDKLALTNVKLIEHDAVDTLKHYFKDQSFSMINIFFPDPWPKLKHHKRRLIQTEVALLLSKKLSSKGSLNIATDWEEYAFEILNCLDNIPSLKNAYPEQNFALPCKDRIVTKFEQKAIQAGRKIWDLKYIKVD